MIRFGEPVGLLMVAVLQFIVDPANPAGLVAELLEPLAPGSYVVISHATADSRPEPAREAAEVERIYDKTTTRARARNRDEMLALVAGLDLVEPGLVWGPLWRPDPGTGLAGDPGRANMYAVVARKPG